MQTTSEVEFQHTFGFELICHFFSFRKLSLNLIINQYTNIKKNNILLAPFRCVRDYYGGTLLKYSTLFGYITSYLVNIPCLHFYFG